MTKLNDTNLEDIELKKRLEKRAKELNADADKWESRELGASEEHVKIKTN